MEQNHDRKVDLKRVHTISILSQMEIMLFQCQNSLLKSPEANEESGEGSYKDKMASRSHWARVRKLLCLLRLKNEAAKNGDSRGGESRGQIQLEESLKRLHTVIGQIKAILKDEKEYKAHTAEAEKLEKKADDLTKILKGIISPGAKLIDMQQISNIQKISEEIFSLKSEIRRNMTDLYLPGLHKSKTFLQTLVVKEVVEKIQNLNLLQMLCLLSFAVFPENSEVKRTMLKYWWIGEGFISTKGAETNPDKVAEAKVDEILIYFVSVGLIEPVKDDRRLKPNRYKMEPHVHSAVVNLAERLGLFNIYNQKGKPVMTRSERDKVSLVEGSWWQQEAKVPWWQKKASESLRQQAEKLSLGQPEGKDSKTNELRYVKTVFNSSERFPDFTFRWFSHMRALKVLYLGRWEQTHERHIEVEKTKFLKDIKDVTELTLLSFQGISRIEKLDDNICQLSKLLILDLRSCYNLEALPEDIDLLESLIYLDVSECFMLARMPKEIANLKKLRVLKGFVVSDEDEKTCMLSELKGMDKLRKLTISINTYDVKEDKLRELMTKLTQLESLKIAWGARFSKHHDEKRGMKDNKNPWWKRVKLRRAIEKQGGHAQHKSVSEKDKNKGDNKGETNKEEKGDAEEKGMPLVEPKDKVQNEKENKGNSKMQMKGDGKIEKVDAEESKERDGEEAETQKSKLDKVIVEDKKTSLSQEQKQVIPKKPDDHKGDDKEQNKEDGRKEVNHEESKEPGGEEANTQASDKVLEEKKRDISSQEPKDLIEENLDDHKGDNKEKVREDGEKERGGEEAEVEKSDKVVEKDNQVSSPKESKEPLTQKNPNDHKGDNREQIKEDGKKEVGQNESKDRGGEEAEAEKSDRIVEEDKNVSPSQESKEPLIQKNPYDLKGDSKEQKKEDGKMEDVDVSKNKEHDGGDARSQNIDKKVEEDKKIGASQDSKATVQKETDDHKKEGKGKAKRKERNINEQDGKEKDPFNLKKLELEGFRGKQPPSWLNPKDLKMLEKLSIRGGDLSSIEGEKPTEENKWRGVKVLRLKYLDAFKAEWKYLHELFPDIELLEKYKCPKVTFCPTNGNGVWSSSQPKASTQKPE